MADMEGITIQDLPSLWPITHDMVGEMAEIEGMSKWTPGTSCSFLRWKLCEVKSQEREAKFRMLIVGDTYICNGRARQRYQVICYQGFQPRLIIILDLKVLKMIKNVSFLREVAQI